MCKYCMGEDLTTNEYYLKEMEIAEDIDRKTNLILYFYENREDVEERVKNLLLEIEKLTAESTEWESKCYHYQDILNELEKEINERITNIKNYGSNFGITIPIEVNNEIDNKLDELNYCLRTLKKLKGDSSNE